MLPYWETNSHQSFCALQSFQPFFEEFNPCVIAKISQKIYGRIKNLKFLILNSDLNLAEMFRIIACKTDVYLLKPIIASKWSSQFRGIKEDLRESNGAASNKTVHIYGPAPLPVGLPRHCRDIMVTQA